MKCLQYRPLAVAMTVSYMPWLWSTNSIIYFCVMSLKVARVNPVLPQSKIVSLKCCLKASLSLRLTYNKNCHYDCKLQLWHVYSIGHWLTKLYCTHFGSIGLCNTNRIIYICVVSTKVAKIRTVQPLSWVVSQKCCLKASLNLSLTFNHRSWHYILFKPKSRLIDIKDN